MRLQPHGLQVLVVTQIEVSGEAVTQMHMLQDGPCAGQVLRCRIISTPQRAGAAGNLGQAMLASVVFGG